MAEIVQNKPCWTALVYTMILKVDFRGRNAQIQGTGETVVLNTDFLYVNCTECTKYYMLLKYILKDLKHRTAKK